MTPEYRGLTWDHPRGYNALAAAADAARDVAIAWDKHSLEGFESRSIAEQCALYDLVVLDHPHVGEAVAADCLVPLENLFAADELAQWGDAAVGPSLASYLYADKHWALPLDAAGSFFLPEQAGTADTATRAKANRALMGFPLDTSRALTLSRDRHARQGNQTHRPLSQGPRPRYS